MNLRYFFALLVFVIASSAGSAQMHDSLPGIKAYVAWVDSVQLSDTEGRTMKTEHKEFFDQPNSKIVGIDTKTGERVEGSSPFSNGYFFIKDITTSPDRSVFYRYQFQDKDSVRNNKQVYYYKNNKIVYAKVWREGAHGDTAYLREEYYVGRSTILSSMRSEHRMFDRKHLESIYLRGTGEGQLASFFDPKRFERKVSKGL